MGAYDQIEKAFQDVVAPALHALRGDIRVLNQKIDGIEQSLTRKIDGVDRELRTAIDVRERLAALEARRAS